MVEKSINHLDVNMSPNTSNLTWFIIRPCSDIKDFLSLHHNFQEVDDFMGDLVQFSNSNFYKIPFINFVDSNVCDKENCCVLKT